MQLNLVHAKTSVGPPHVSGVDVCTVNKTKREGGNDYHSLPCGKLSVPLYSC